MNCFTKFAIACHQHAWDLNKPYFYTGNDSCGTGGALAFSNKYPPKWSWRTECAMSFYTREIAEKWIRTLVAEGITSNYNVLIDGTVLAMHVEEINEPTR